MIKYNVRDRRSPLKKKKNPNKYIAKLNQQINPTPLLPKEVVQALESCTPLRESSKCLTDEMIRLALYLYKFKWLPRPT